jgi:hypothetical protein
VSLLPPLKTEEKKKNACLRNLGNVIISVITDDVGNVPLRLASVVSRIAFV